MGKIEIMDKKISFVGVGPGDPELLTLKALKKITIADVIIWTDSLIPEKILDSAKEGSEKIKTSSLNFCLLYTSPSPRDIMRSRMPSSA